MKPASIALLVLAAKAIAFPSTLQKRQEPTDNLDVQSKSEWPTETNAWINNNDEKDSSEPVIPAITASIVGSANLAKRQATSRTSSTTTTTTRSSSTTTTATTTRSSTSTARSSSVTGTSHSSSTSTTRTSSTTRPSSTSTTRTSSTTHLSSTLTTRNSSTTRPSSSSTTLRSSSTSTTTRPASSTTSTIRTTNRGASTVDAVAQTTSTTTRASTTTTTSKTTTSTKPTTTSTTTSRTTTTTSKTTSTAGATRTIDVTGMTYQNAMLTAHNLHRANHSIPNLVWNQGLANTAQHIADNCVYGHNVTADGGGYGQNIGAGAAGNAAAGLITNLMYDAEINYYPGPYGVDDVPLDNFHLWGHYSQLVWSDTTDVGCVTKYCPNGLANTGPGVAPYFTVCNYSPPGNYVGEFSSVAAPGGGVTAVIVGS